MAYKTTEFNTASPVSALPGVGPAKQAAYKKIGVSTLGDLINHVPRAYENRGEIRPLDCSRDDGKTAVVLTVCTPVQSSRLRGGKTVIKFRASDDSGLCDLVFFNQPYLKGTFVTGSVWRFWGKVERRLTRNGMRYSMSSPVYERWEPGMLQDFTPVYPLTDHRHPSAGDHIKIPSLHPCLRAAQHTQPGKLSGARGRETSPRLRRAFHLFASRRPPGYAPAGNRSVS